jgi:small subunit ribosomal protein S20
MPTIKSAKKALRQNIKKHKVNLKTKNKMKKIIKDLNSLSRKLEKSAEKITDENIKEIQDGLKMAYKAIDKTAKKKIIKKNTASRKKSKLAKKINALEKKLKK